MISTIPHKQANKYGSLNDEPVSARPSTTGIHHFVGKVKPEIVFYSSTKSMLWVRCRNGRMEEVRFHGLSVYSKFAFMVMFYSRPAAAP